MGSEAIKILFAAYFAVTWTCTPVKVSSKQIADTCIVLLMKLLASWLDVFWFCAQKLVANILWEWNVFLLCNAFVVCVPCAVMTDCTFRPGKTLPCSWHCQCHAASNRCSAHTLYARLPPLHVSALSATMIGSHYAFGHGSLVVQYNVVYSTSLSVTTHTGHHVPDHFMPEQDHNIIRMNLV